MARSSQGTRGLGNYHIFNVWCHGSTVDNGFGVGSGYVDQDGEFHSQSLFIMDIYMYILSTSLTSWIFLFFILHHQSLISNNHFLHTCVYTTLLP